MKASIRGMLAALFIGLGGLMACAPAAGYPGQSTPITVQLNWTHQTQFAGLYAADQKGYYAAEGVTAVFLQGGPEVDKFASVLDGAAQFGVAGADELIVARSEGKPVRAIATIYRRSPVAFVALADSGITRLDQFVGKTIRVTANVAPSLHAMMGRVGISSGQYREVTLPNDLKLFASGQPPVWGVYITAFAVEVQQAGYNLNVIYPSDYGVHFYADALFATDDFIAAKPDVVRRFLRSTLKGWTYAVENAAATGPLVAKYQPAADVDLETAKMVASIPLINTGEDHVGWMRPEVWASMEKTLREQGVLARPVDAKEVYTTQFVREIYGK